MTKALTVASILRRKGGKKRVEVWDLHGLVLIVQPTGAKSFAYRFRNVDGKPARLNLGAFTDIELSGAPQVGQALTLVAARQLVHELKRRLDGGEDLLLTYRAAKRQIKTVAAEASAASFLAGARLYIERGRARSQRGGKDRSRGWRTSALTIGLRYPGTDGPYKGETPEVIPGSIVARWHDRPVASITRVELSVLIDESIQRGVPGRVARVKGENDSRGREVGDVLVPLFAFLQSKNWIDVNPATNLDVPPPPIKRDRVLNSRADLRAGDEVRLFWEATESLKTPFKEALQLLLILGQRRSEVAEARWDEFNDNFTLWTIPAARSKNGLQHTVPLPEAAREILRSLPRNGPFVFTTTGRTPISGWSKTKIALDKRIAELAGAPLPEWRIHDLRRSAATGMAQIGIAPHIVSAVQNHLTFKSGVAGVYNHATYDSEQASALTRWSEHVARLVSGQTADNVVAFG